MKPAAGAMLALVSLAGVACVLAPLMLLQPFGGQSAAGISTAFTLRTHGAALTLALLAAGIALAWLLVRRLRSWKGYALCGLALAALAGSAVLARINPFETMFRPLPRPEFTRAAGADHLSDADLVLGVQVGDEARAYPVRALAYHHLVNDVVGGEPLVATY